MSWEASAWARRQGPLDPTEKLVLLLVADYANHEGRCWPSVPTLAREANLSERSVQRVVARLEQKGMLQRGYRFREDGSQASNYLQLCMGEGVTPMTPPGDTVSPPPVTPTSPLEPVSMNLQPSVVSQGTKKRGAVEYPEAFLRIWQELPARKGSDPKDKALKAFNARLREGVTEEEMLEGAKRYAHFCDETGKTGSEYVMQGARFFGPGREWENEWAVS